MELKDKIKELRVKNYLTQDRLAEKLNVSRQTISKYELGINEPSVEVLKDMCRIFECDISELIQVNDKDPKEEKREKINRILFYAIVALLVYGIFLVLTFIRFLPGTIPMHYDVNFVPDRYGSKYELLLVSIIMILPLIFALTSRIVKTEVFEEYKIKNFKMIINITTLVVEVVFLVMMLVICSISLEEPFKYLSNILTTLFGGLFILLAVFGSPLFNKRPNPFFGYRTRFSLRNSQNWKKLNTCQCIGSGISGLIIVILGLTVVTEYSFLFVIILLLSVIITCIYESILKTKVKKSKID